MDFWNDYQKNEWLEEILTLKNDRINTRVDWIDGIKGLGILLVMISHLGIAFAWQPYICACYMAMFFVISGYTYKNKESANIYIVNRAKRLLIPWLFWGWTIVITMGIFSGFSVKKIVVNLLKHLYSRFCFFPYGQEPNVFFMDCGNSPLWFFTALFVSSVAYKILMKCVGRKRIFVMIIYVLITIMMSNLPILLPWSMDTAFMGAIFMLWGNVLSQKRENFAQNEYIRICLLLTSYLVLVFFNGGINMSVRVWGEHGWISAVLCMLIGLQGSTLYIWILQKFEASMVVRLLALIGRSSVVILVIHFPLYKVLELLILRSGMDISDYGSGSVKIIVALITCLLIKKIGDRLTEKIGFIRYVL